MMMMKMCCIDESSGCGMVMEAEMVADEIIKSYSKWSNPYYFMELHELKIHAKKLARFKC